MGVNDTQTISVKALKVLMQFLLLPKIIQDKLYIAMKYDMSYEDIAALYKPWGDYDYEQRKEYKEYLNAK